MLTQLRRPISLSLYSMDGLIESEIETVGTLYQKGDDRYHLLLTEPVVQDSPWSLIPQHAATPRLETVVATSTPSTPRLLWIEFSPHRVTMTMQGNGQFSYRHLFEPHVFGVSRYWLQTQSAQQSQQFRLRNFTRHLHVKGHPTPCHLLMEYELWSEQLCLGQYVLDLEICPN
jgi:hypothetical protein